MKNLRNTLMCAGLLLAAVLSINSCQKPSGEGSGVRFRARTFSSPLTKTEYGGATGGKELIKWVSGDQLRIACAQCTPTSAYYRVTGTITSDGAISEADALTPVSGNDLQWGTGSHTFYAVYPADVDDVTTAGKAYASLPASQGGADTATSSSTSEGVTTVSMVPDMSNAFMYASQEVDEPGSDVELTFKPMFTAFQFTVGGDGTGGDVTLKSVDLISTSCALSGGFSLNIGDNTYTIPGWEEYSNDKIIYTFPANTTINTTKKVCFTLFVQPSSNVTGNANLNGTSGVITDLTIRFTLGDNTTRALKLKYDASTHGGNFVDFPGGHKINITGLTLPTQLKSWSFTVLDVDDWADDSPDILYGSPEVVEPGEGWIAETFAPDVNDLVDGGEYDKYSLSCFSVSATQKVRFSPGNLQYRASTGTWRFAEHQWDYVGDDNASIGETYSGWIDLFGWGTSGYRFETGYGSSYQPWQYTEDMYEVTYGPTDWTSDLTGNFAEGDWGYAVASTLGFGWRTLTYDEFHYLFRTRNEAYRFCTATVNGVAGVVLFPDGYSHPFGVTSPIYVNDYYLSHPQNNTWSGDEWTKMESAGCVFLPAAGYRKGKSVDGVGSSCYYWSSTHLGYNAYTYIGSGRESYTPDFRCYGYSVRLAQDL